MTDQELIQALRCCAEGECKGCAVYADKQSCQENILARAADRLEKLSQRVLAQLALVESCDVPVDEVFLPYLADKSGRTLYQAYSAGQLMLEG